MKISNALLLGGIVLFLLFSAVVQVEAQSCTPAPSGLIGWWDGDAVSGNTAFDLVGGNDGTFVGDTTTTAGFVGNAFSFDGNGDYIQLPFDSGIFTNQYTIEAWAFPTKEVGASFLQGIFDNDVSGNRGVSLAVFEIAPLNVAGTTHNSGGTQTAISNVPSAANQWNHYALTYDGSELCLYQNGVLEGCNTATGTVRDNNVNFRIGDGQFDSDSRRFYGGLIDEVEIYDRALSGPATDCTDPADRRNEICDIFLAGRAGKCKNVEVNVEVSVDIKPQSCPNPINTKSKGVIPVAIMGTDDLDVIEIEIVSLQLVGVQSFHVEFEDVGTPFEPFLDKDSCTEDCNELRPDGIIDLTMKFDTQAVVKALGDDVEDGDCLALELTGNMNDGTPIVGEDVVVIKKKGK